ncbi:uncharacterized protein LOC109595831 isoform X2 [Aethina tumida]|uniref:uncharacterized protein LOC109595831 isoform X2 n=1 Tax=Aethina tumida TaxID=116153 RepID=UPI002148061D|nr:uncharacterized protein LOC109595831 isoform X2 [Aethina tumida]
MPAYLKFPDLPLAWHKFAGHCRRFYGGHIDHPTVDRTPRNDRQPRQSVRRSIHDEYPDWSGLTNFIPPENIKMSLTRGEKVKESFSKADNSVHDFQFGNKDTRHKVGSKFLLSKFNLLVEKVSSNFKKNGGVFSNSNEFSQTNLEDDVRGKRSMRKMVSLKKSRKSQDMFSKHDIHIGSSQTGLKLAPNYFVSKFNTLKDKVSSSKKTDRLGNNLYKPVEKDSNFKFAKGKRHTIKYSVHRDLQRKSSKKQKNRRATSSRHDLLFENGQLRYKLGNSTLFITKQIPVNAMIAKPKKSKKVEVLFKRHQVGSTMFSPLKNSQHKMQCSKRSN